MKVLSLFDGISCGQQALKNLGIIPKYYLASEIDKYAIAITQHNFPKTMQVGDIKKFKGEGYICKRIDLMFAGFPCQSFSNSGKGGGFSDSRGGLFFDLIRLRDKIKPKFFLFENVRMKKEFLDVINKEIGIEPVEINSSLLTAQSRKRLYWVGKLQEDGTYKKVDIEQPEEKGIVLKDILESGIVDRDKSYCLDASYFKGGNLKSYFQKGRRQLVFSKQGLCHVAEANIKGNDSIKRVYSPGGKSPTLTTMGGGHREPKIITDQKPFMVQKSRGKNSGGVKAFDGKTPTMTSNSWEHNNHVVCGDNYYYRKLTTIECERLQGMQDNKTAMGTFDGVEKKVSNSQRYKCLGNGWTVPVIEHILGTIFKTKEVT